MKRKITYSLTILLLFVIAIHSKAQVLQDFSIGVTHGGPKMPCLSVSGIFKLQSFITNDQVLVYFSKDSFLSLEEDSLIQEITISEPSDSVIYSWGTEGFEEDVFDRLFDLNTDTEECEWAAEGYIIFVIISSDASDPQEYAFPIEIPICIVTGISQVNDLNTELVKATITNQSLLLETSEPELEILVLSSNGKEVMNRTISNGQNDINLYNLREGYYIVKAYNDLQLQTMKIYLSKQ